MHEHLFHITRVDNLRSILSNGLLVRRDLDLQEIGYEPSIGKDFEHVAFFVGRPDVRVYEQMREASNTPDSQWAILELSSSALESVAYLDDTNELSGSAVLVALAPGTVSPENLHSIHFFNHEAKVLFEQAMPQCDLHLRVSPKLFLGKQGEQDWEHFEGEETPDTGQLLTDYGANIE